MPISRIAAAKIIVDAVTAAAIPGLCPRDRTLEQDARSGSLFFRWELCYTVGCDLDVTIDGRDGVEVKIGWSSTGRTPAAARASARLYADVSDLGCLIEAITAKWSVEAA